jgi:hypothetical protein
LSFKEERENDERGNQQIPKTKKTKNKKKKKTSRKGKGRKARVTTPSSKGFRKEEEENDRPQNSG